MKELLKISHGFCDRQKADSLYNYELCIHEGDIFYIQGLEGTGVKTLARVIAGDFPLESGFFYIEEEKIGHYDRNMANRKGIYVISGENALVEKMTVADNLEAVRAVRSPFLLYSSRRALKRAEEFLKEEQVDIPADAHVWSLKRKDRLKLGIVKAKMHGARLIVLDMTGHFYGGIEAEELCGLIRRLNGEGISFLILSESYNQFAEIASRVQILSQGRDLKEWSRITDRVRQILRDQVAAVPEREKPEPWGFFGMYDYEWEMRDGFWEFLRHVKSHNRELWDTYIGGTVPADGCGRAGDTVVVPADSAALLLNHLTISDNLIMPIPDRVAWHRGGVIPGRVEKNLVERYRKDTGADPEAAYPEDLSRVQKKILSIYRYALGRPKRVILENPYLGLDFYEARQLREYLGELKEKGTGIFYFSRDAQEFQEDCSRLLVTEKGKRGKITTIS